MEDAVSIFGFKAADFIVEDIYGIHAPTEVKEIILSYPSIMKVMVYSYCEILWSDNSGSVLGRHPTANYSEVLDDAQKQAIISQHHLRSNILGLCINKDFTTDSKRKLRAFRYSYTFNTQDDGSVMSFLIFLML